MGTSKKKKKSGLLRLLELSGHKKGLLFASCIMAVFHALLTMVPYVVTLSIMDGLISGTVNAAEIHALLLKTFFAVLLAAVLMYASAMASHIAAFNILYGLRCAITDRLGKLPIGYLGDRSSGALKKIIADDVERIELFIAHSLPDTVKAVVLPCIILGVLFWVDWRMALASLLPVILFFALVSFLSGGEKKQNQAKEYHKSLEAMNAGIVEYVRAMPVMKIFGQSASSFSKYSDTVRDFDQKMKGWVKVMSPPWAMTISFLTNLQLPLLVFGIYLYFQGKLGLPVFYLFLILGTGYIRPAFKLTTIIFDLTMISRGVARMDEILFEAQEQESGTTPLADNFSLEFENVSFSYVKGIDAVSNLSFKVPQGTITALVGPSGSGKSTAGKLAARFYDPDSGKITLGGIAVSDFTMHDLMETVGFVFQDNYMFQQSLYDNIRMGMEKTEEEVIAAAKIARCHDFISQLPDGYQTIFGGKGVHLSGGEQQRIQLARVILKDPQVLVLDEATAFSDPENEDLIMAAIGELIQNKTVIIIAHRLSTIAHSDQIVVLNNGSVEAAGTHNELIDGSGLYEKMWNAHIRAKEFEIKVKDEGKSHESA